MLSWKSLNKKGEKKGNKKVKKSRIFVGIDIGSITAKAALIKNNKLMETLVIPTGYNPVTAGQKVFSNLIFQTKNKQEDITAIVATGYGRASVDFADKAITEILCHGAGAHFLTPDIRGIIDVGGQDSKAIALDVAGHERQVRGRHWKIPGSHGKGPGSRAG